MSLDVYSSEVNFAGSFSAERARIVFSDFAVGLITQQLGYEYTQQLSRIYEVGSPDVYLVKGRTSGMLTAARVMGPKRLMPAFYTKYGDVCQAARNNLKVIITTGCNTTGQSEQSIDMRNVTLATIRGSIDVQQLLLNETLGFSFLYMQMN